MEAQLDPNYPGVVFVVKIDPNGQIDPNKGTTKQGFDAFGRLAVSIDQSGHATNLAYSNGKLSSITDALGNQTSYVYGVVGAPAIVKARRLLYQTQFPGGVSETYAYNNDGTLASVLKRDGTT